MTELVTKQRACVVSNYASPLAWTTSMQIRGNGLTAGTARFRYDVDMTFGLTTLLATQIRRFRTVEKYHLGMIKKFKIFMEHVLSCQESIYAKK